MRVMNQVSVRSWPSLALSGLVWGLVLLGVSGCTQLGYYHQAVSGHVSIMRAKQPVSEVLARDDTPEALRDKLRLTQQALDFAVRELGLPDNGSYRHYVDLKRPYSTWNVVATEAFSLRPKPWCFLLVGCLNYRGYYAKEDAEHTASALKAEGFDVSLSPSSAYSTLGYFRDPLFSTMLRYDDLRVVGTLFHELAHQKLYLKKDSQFNESFASFIEQEGLKRWLQARGTPELMAVWQARQGRRADFLALLEQARRELIELYQRDITPAQMRDEKQLVFSQLKRNYHTLRQTRWGSSRAYSSWFEQPLNNAHLALVSTYNLYTPAFERVLLRLEGDLPAFYQEARRLSVLPEAERLAQMGLGGAVALPDRH